MVLVTSRASPEYALAVGRVAAVVSEAGSATSHLATVLREARLPAVFGAKGAAGLLQEGDLVTVDAYYGNVYAGKVDELLKAPRGGDEVVRQSRAFKVLERALKHITPLNLLDPRAENFRPEACRTYHDITRFAHEKAMEELFQMSAGRLVGRRHPAPGEPAAPGPAPHRPGGRLKPRGRRPGAGQARAPALPAHAGLLEGGHRGGLEGPQARGPGRLSLRGDERRHRHQYQ